MIIYAALHFRVTDFFKINIFKELVKLALTWKMLYKTLLKFYKVLVVIIELK